MQIQCEKYIQNVMSSNSPQVPQPQVGPHIKPRIMLNIPTTQTPMPGGYYSPAISPYLNAAGTHTYPAQYGGGPPQWPPSTPYASPFVGTSYHEKAGDFMFKQFEGFKDFTKSGLNMGEKSAFYIYNKFSRWSRKWFTHIFLFIVVLLYTVAGALIFQTVEGMYGSFFTKELFVSISLFVIKIDPTSKPKFFIQPYSKKKHLITFLGKGQENATKQFADMKFQFSRDLYTIARQSDTRAVISKTFFVC